MRSLQCERVCDCGGTVAGADASPKTRTGAGFQPIGKACPPIIIRVTFTAELPRTYPFEPLSVKDTAPFLSVQRARRGSSCLPVPASIGVGRSLAEMNQQQIKQNQQQGPSASHGSLLLSPPAFCSKYVSGDWRWKEERGRSTCLLLSILGHQPAHVMWAQLAGRETRRGT